MFYDTTLLTKKGVFALAWLAGTVRNLSQLKGYMDKLLKVHGSANIIAICNSVLKPTVPLSLRTRATLMLGIVRLFSEQVVQIERHANMFLQRVNQSRYQVLPPHIAEKMVEYENNPEELFLYWRDLRERTENITCQTVPAGQITFHASIAETRSLKGQTSSSLESDQELMDFVNTFLEESSNDTYFVVKRVNQGVDIFGEERLWKSTVGSSSGEFGDEFETLRDGDISHRSSVMSGRFDSINLSRDSEHFLDILIGGDESEAAGQEHLKMALDELEAQDFMMHNLPPLEPQNELINSLFDSFNHSIPMDINGGQDDDYMDYGGGPNGGYEGFIASDDPALSFGTGPMNDSITASVPKSSLRLQELDEETTIRHSVLKATIEKFKSLPEPRPWLVDPSALTKKATQNHLARLLKEKYSIFPLTLNTFNVGPTTATGVLQYLKIVYGAAWTTNSANPSLLSSLHISASGQPFNHSPSRLDPRAFDGYGADDDDRGYIADQNLSVFLAPEIAAMDNNELLVDFPDYIPTNSRPVSPNVSPYFSHLYEADVAVPSMLESSLADKTAGPISEALLGYLAAKAATIRPKNHRSASSQERRTSSRSSSRSLQEENEEVVDKIISIEDILSGRRCRTAAKVFLQILCLANAGKLVLTQGGESPICIQVPTAKINQQ